MGAILADLLWQLLWAAFNVFGTMALVYWGFRCTGLWFWLRRNRRACATPVQSRAMAGTLALLLLCFGAVACVRLAGKIVTNYRAAQALTEQLDDEPCFGLPAAPSAIDI